MWLGWLIEKTEKLAVSRDIKYYVLEKESLSTDAFSFAANPTHPSLHPMYHSVSLLSMNDDSRI